MSSDNESVINSLIKISIDGEEGFHKAAEHTNDQDLKIVFEERAAGCTQAVMELQNHARQLNIAPENKGSILGTLHRGWIDILCAVTCHDNHTILSECERGESAAKENYAEALSKNISSDVRVLIQKQYEGVQKSYETIRSLQEKYPLK